MKKIVRSTSPPRSSLIDQLHELVNLHGAAQVAVWLGYKDTRAILQWIQRKQVPESRVTLLKFVIKSHKNLKIEERSA